MATTSTWAEALAFLTRHLQDSAQVGAASPSHLTPDLRYVDYQPPPVIARNGNGHHPAPSVGRQPFVRLLGALVRVALGALRLSPSS